jgi:4-aminobutyrate aminotransferase-like enzyme
MVEQNVPERAEARGRQVREGLQRLQSAHPWIGEVRGMGLMQAIEIVRDPVGREPDPARTRALMAAARDEGLLIGAGGLAGQVIRIGPSLLITEEETTEALRRLERACRAVDDG